MSNAHFDNDAISFAERALTLVDQGVFVATYKYAVLLGLMDLVLEYSSKTGIPPSVVTTRQLAEKVIQIYWLHTNPFESDKKFSNILLQNNGREGAQASIISAINKFRCHSLIGTMAPLFSAKYADKNGYEKLVDSVEWTLIKMPLPKLQRVGKQVRDFIYTINWDDDVKRGTVSAYQRKEKSDFDNRIILRPYVGEYLVRLNNLLRRLIQREWSIKVAQLNKLEESKLQNFLFDSARAGAAVMCSDLSELQEHRCFYCGEKLSKTQDAKPEVDHFIPWARYSNDNLANFVVAHSKCNRDKRDYLAGNQHIAHWMQRIESAQTITDLNSIAVKHKWLLNEEAAQGVASAIYLHLQPEVELWRMGKEFEAVNTTYIRKLFC